MTNATCYLNLAIERIKKIPLGKFYSSEKACLLWSEFIRRFYELSDSYTEKNITSYCFDVEDLCNINFSEDVKALIKKVTMTSFINKIDHIPEDHTWLTRDILRSYLLWNAAMDQNNSIAIQFKDLYEPVIRIAEANVIIIVKSSRIHIGNNMYAASGSCNRSWAAKEPIDIDLIQLPFFELLPD